MVSRIWKTPLAEIIAARGRPDSSRESEGLVMSGDLVVVAAVERRRRENDPAGRLDMT